ncbi:MAG: hypothetical protein RLW61_21915 [Gammaproteobacteria bacterium]
MTQEAKPRNPSRDAGSAARQVLRARALVAGLAPSVMPMIMREWRDDVLLLAFDGPSGAVDERWATQGAGVVIIFKAGNGENTRRTSLLGRLRARGPRGIEVGLVALDADSRSALTSLARSPAAPAAAPSAKAAAAAPEMTADAIAALCLASIRQQLPAVGEAYLDGLAAHLAGRRAAAQSDAEDRRFATFEAELAAARPRLHEAIIAEALPSVASALSADESGAGGGASSGGLSLLESIDLRATLLVTEAVENIAAQLRGEWLDLEPRLAQVAASRGDVNALAPAVFCHRFRDAIFFDHQFGALRQADLAAGFSADFVARLAQLYRTLSALLERHGIHGVGGAHGRPAR